jgi:hypothetical protein
MCITNAAPTRAFQKVCTMHSIKSTRLEAKISYAIQQQVSAVVRISPISAIPNVVAPSNLKVWEANYPTYQEKIKKHIQNIGTAAPSITWCR